MFAGEFDGFLVVVWILRTTQVVSSDSPTSIARTRTSGGDPEDNPLHPLEDVIGVEVKWVLEGSLPPARSI